MTLSRRRITIIVAVILAVFAAIVVLTFAAWSGGDDEPSPQAIELRF